MSKRADRFCALVVASAFPLLLAGAALAQKASATKTPDIVAIGKPHVMQLMLLMETDKSGKVSKDQWIKFMEAEFDRLDKARTGELNIKDLKEPQAPPARFTTVGK